MKKNAKLTTLILISTLLIFTMVGSVQAAPNYNRYSGQDRFQTSIAIARQEFQGQQVQNVILASAYSFPDALAASTLATKLKAPIILVGSGLKESQISLNYIKNHMTAGGTVTIVGGVAVVPKKVEEWLLNNGYVVTRLGGNDRFATDALIVKRLNVSPGTPVVIASGYGFPDALGVASIAASKGWPILLSGPNQLPDSVQSFIKSDQPSNVYIVGGQAVLHNSLQTAIQTAAPSTQITRFAGQDRFETLSQLLTKFFPNPTQIYLANGFDFADALSGSTLAAQNNAPILLIDPKSGHLPPAIRDYLVTIRNTGSTPQVNALGGSVSVPEWVIKRVNELLGSSVTSPAVAPLTVSNPSATGFTVLLNPAINGLTVSNFKLLDSLSAPITVAGATTPDGGATYAISASLSAGQTYMVRATDASGNNLGTPQNVVVPTTAVTLSLPTTTLTNATVGSPYNANLSATGGTSPYTYTLVSGSSLPVGLVLGTDGMISGTPTSVTTSAAFTVDVTDSATPTAGKAIQTFTLTVDPAVATVSSASTLDSTHIVLTMSSALTGSSGDPAAYKISGVASNSTVTNVTVAGTTVTLALSAPIVNSDSSVTVSYTKTGISDLSNGTPVANFSNQSVTNNV